MTQSWMGSDFSYNDLAKSEDIITDYTHRLTATAQADGHTVWTIEATPKPGAPVVWGKVALEVRDDYRADGRDLLRPGHEARPAHDRRPDRHAGRPALSGVMTMHPLDQPSQWTRIETSDAQFNVAPAGLPLHPLQPAKSEVVAVLAALAWRNLWRRPQRTVLSLISIAIVSALLVFMLSFQDGVYATMKETTLRIFDGYAELQPDGYADDPRLERAIADPERAGARGRGRRRRHDGRAAGQRLRHPGQRPAQLRRGGGRGRSRQRGEDLHHRRAHLRRPLPARRRHQPADPRRHPGQEPRRQASAASSPCWARRATARSRPTCCTVAGVYHSGIPDLDRSILEMPLARAQDTFGMEGAANTIALGGPSLGAVNRALPALQAIGQRSGVAVRDWQAMEPAMRDAIDLKYATSMLFYASLVVVVAFIILNTLLMSVLERTREFGMLLALGMRSGQIGAMVWIELLGAGAARLGDRRRRSAAAVTLWLQQRRHRLADRPEGDGAVRHALAALSGADAVQRLHRPGALLLTILRRRPRALTCAWRA